MPQWSDKDIAFLQENFYNMPLEELALQLNRSKEAVRSKARVMGLYKHKSKITKFYPETGDKVRDHLGNYLDDMESIRDRLQKWIERLEEKKSISASELIALSKTMDSLTKAVETLSKIYRIVENQNVNVENMTINMNTLQLIQTANEVMHPDQRIEFTKRLVQKGIVDDISLTR